MREGRNDAALPFRDAVRKRQLSGTARHGVRAVKGAASVGEIRSEKGPEMFAGGEFGGWVFPPGQRRRRAGFGKTRTAGVMPFGAQGSSAAAFASRSVRYEAKAASDKPFPWIFG